MRIEQVPAYELIKQEQIDDIQSMAYILRHKKSGANICIVENTDDNKVFNVGFRTPPPNHTGVPHILEHSVLCGSKNFPAKDPFVELVKGSLNTFLNAMTYPDRTMYPVASMNQKDFQNLIHVYMDAVFYPKIYEREEIFLQEGWSYQLEHADDALVYNGVVYNEMKGVFSSADSVLSREIMNSLYPDTAYAKESGGHPDNIPELTYQQFLDFHHTFYHPSNSYIYLYGDMDMVEKLNWLDQEYLSEFDEKQIESTVGIQESFDMPKLYTKEYPISDGESETENTYLSYNIAIGENDNVQLNLAYEILEYLLISTPGAPLRKALIDAGIGNDVYGRFEDDTKYSFFSIIAKNAEEDQKETFTQIIEETLSSIIEHGLDKGNLESAINYLEFQYKEADYGRFPKGLIVALQIYSAWIYDNENIFMNTKRSSLFNDFKEKIHTNYFEDLIKTYMLDNKHKSWVVLKPEKGLLVKQEEEIAKKLAEYKASLSKEEIEQLISKTKQLRKYQEEVTSKEDLEKIPLLTREDIEKKAAPYSLDEKKVGSIPVMHHNLETNGIGYLSFIFSADSLSEDLIPYFGLLCSVLGYIDTEQYTYGQLFNETNRNTGGILYTITIFGNPSYQNGSRVTFEIRSKALHNKQSFIFDMVKEVLNHSKLNDTKRLKEIIDELKSRLKSSLVSSGHSTAMVRGLSYLSYPQYYSDLTSGVAFYQFIDDLSRNFNEKQEVLSEKLYEVINLICTPKNLLVSYTSNEEGYQQMTEPLNEFVQNLFPDQDKTLVSDIKLQRKNEGFKTSSKVQYVARVGNYIKDGYTYTGAMKVLSSIMNTEYMWINVRVKGGAYGCMSGFYRNGDSFFVSYRDPNLEATNDVFEGIPDYIENFTVDERDMTKYIIGTISDIDLPLTPRAKGTRSLTAYMMGITYEMLQKERDEILNTTQETIRELAPRIREVLNEKTICAIGNEDRIEHSALFKNKVNLFIS